MSTDKYLPYRGDVKAAVAVEGKILFVTVHSERQATALYRLDAEKWTLAEDALPVGGVALVADGDTVWIAGSDGRVYQGSSKGGVVARGPTFASPPTALALLADDRLAVLADKEIAVLRRKDGKALQTLALPEMGSSLAADPSGHWLVAGTVKGTVIVFDCEEKEQFLAGESQRLHDGAVTALLFEPDELRFLSAGADQKLLLTHARGKLEPEDKGRGNNHTDLVTSLVWGPGDRFYSGSRDTTVKGWPRVGAVRPASLKDGVGRVVALAIVPIHKRPHLAALCDDNTLRFFLLDAAGKFGEATVKVHDYYAWTRQEFAQSEVRPREAAMRSLAEVNDTASIELIAARIGQDDDHGLRLLATELLGGSNHGRAAKFLEENLGHHEEAVRVAAFHGLRKHRGVDNLDPLTLALRAAKSNIGILAVQALEGLAKKDDQAMALLVKGLNAKTLEVRQAALASLEKIHDASSPEADLLALDSKHADIRRYGLIRLFQRKLLAEPRVPAALRRRGEDEDAVVRRTAFLVSLFTREKLVAALRARDAELQRQLVEIETFGQDPGEEKKGKATKPPTDKPKLDDADYDPLLQASASRTLDTCLGGARGLAILGDARAFALLLQLSRESDTQARAEVCRALAALDDDRAVKRLRSLLFDPEAAVRDAAFTALAHIQEEDPLTGAEAGLHAAFEDVRRRGLQVLVSHIRKAKGRTEGTAGALLIFALNDRAEGVRGEAFKAALNLQVGGGGVQTLRFVLRSVHADVRREVLTEVMAQATEPWAWQLLLEFFNDHDPKLREEAFAFALKKTKELEPLQAGLRSEYPDLRKQAVAALVKRHTAAAQGILVQALADADKQVRQLALDSLVLEDALTPLTEALRNSHADVRVRAARTLARHGAPEALKPLLELIAVPEPPERERLADWTALVEAALFGLGDLGDGSALPSVTPFLNSKHATLRAAAADALTWVALPHHFEALQQTLHHADPKVRYRAALGLAYAGDPLGASLVFSDDAARYLTAQERLVAAVTLGSYGEDQLTAFLDDEDRKISDHAELVAMLRDLKDETGTPTRCLAALAARPPGVRLSAAMALNFFSEPKGLLKIILVLLNARSDGPKWQIAADTVDALAESIVYGDAQVKARTAHLLRFLLKEDLGGNTAKAGDRPTANREENIWKQQWDVHSRRFAKEITALHEKAKERKPVPSSLSAAELRELVFGAYVGLARALGGAATSGFQQVALRRILALTEADKKYTAAARPVFVQALGDPDKDVRSLAFEQLQAIGMDATTLAAEALEAGHVDLGIRGLELLTSGASAAKGQKILEQAMLTRNDELAWEAADMLLKQRGQSAVAGPALNAAYERLRSAAVIWLAEAYDKDDAAKKFLRQAVTSRYLKVRQEAALALAAKKDPTAFDVIVALLAEAIDKNRQARYINALVSMGDPRAVNALLDRLRNDPSGTAHPDALLAAAASFRQEASAEPLLAMLENKAWKQAAFEAVRTVSGYDQDIDDAEDESPDKTWLMKQHPRRDGVLARLMERCQSLGQTDLLGQLLTGARWAHGPEVDPILGQLAAHPDEATRNLAVEAVGWRLRKRKGPADPLTRALVHKDAVTQLVAAEGLAKAGRAEGVGVLLAAVDFMDDYILRWRAVTALGELADVRALDTLLRLASEDGHAMQQAAAEAIGHLGKSAKADDIQQLLERHAKGTGGVAENALIGLRWLNTRAGWQLIRQRLIDPACHFRATAAELLGFNDEPATRDLLLGQLAHDEDDDVLEAALKGARRLLGSDSLEPNYALLQNEAAESLRVMDDTLLKRVRERGEAKRLFEILPRCPEDVKTVLASTLLDRAPLPVAEAKAALQNTDARTVQLAAQILGRAGAKLAAAGPALAAALEKWRTTWDESRDRMARTNQGDGSLTASVTPLLETLLWSAGRLGVAREGLMAAAAARADDPLYRPIRRAAVAALASAKLTDDIVSVIETALSADDPELRSLAADLLRRHSAKKAEQLAERSLSDPASFRRLTAGGGASVKLLRAAAEQGPAQGVALPLLIGHADVEGLKSIAENRKLPEATRLGAIEGLARVASQPARDILAAMGKADKEDEEIRKSAWRALRRSKRTRPAKPAEVTA